MPISLNKPLMVEEIARFWSQELRGTRFEESAENLMTEIMAALVARTLASHRGENSIDRAFETIDALTWCGFIAGRMEGAEKTTQLYQELCTDAVRETLRYRDHDGLENAAGAIDLLMEVKVTRAEFMRWVDAQGYQPHPTFWDGDRTPAAPATTGRHAKLDSFILERIAAGRTPVPGQAFYDEARDHCDGWKDRQKRVEAQYFGNKTIQRRLEDILDKMDN